MLKKFASQEEFAPATVDEDAVIEYVIDETGAQQEEEQVQEARHQLDILTESNEAWLKIMQHAVKNDTVSVELKAAFESHMNHVQQILGSVVDEDISSLESFKDDHVTYCHHAVASLEGVGRTLKQVGDRLAKGLRRVFVDCSAYTKQQKAIDALIADLDGLHRQIESSSADSCTMDTSAQTNCFSHGGLLATDLPNAFKKHFKAVNEICTQYAPKAHKSIVEVLNVVFELNRARSSEAASIIKRLAGIKRPADFIKKEWTDGTTLLRNCYFRPTRMVARPYPSGASYQQVISTFSDNFDTEWGYYSSTSKAKDITLSKKQAIDLIAMSKLHLQSLRQSYSKMIDEEERVCYDAENLCGDALRDSDKRAMLKNTIKDSVLPADKRALRAATDIMFTATKSDRMDAQERIVPILERELNWWYLPVRRSIFNSIVLIRGLKAFLKRYN